MPARPTLGAIAVLIREEHALLVQRGKSPDAGLWGYPGGHVELGETALDAAIRELAEETGVTAEPIDYLTNIDVLRRDGAGDVTAHYLLAAVLCDWRSGEPVAADDARAADWVPLSDIHSGKLEMSARVPDVTRLAQARLAGRTK